MIKEKGELRRIIPELMLVLIAISIFSFSRILPANAQGTIYIKADGSIDPPTAPITDVGNLAYTFFGDISDRLVVERDNIVVDGAGYSIQTPSFQIGIDLSYTSNVTVKNMVVRNAFAGTYFNHTTTATLIDNNLMNNGFGILLHNSSNCRITGNSVTSNQNDGIQVTDSSDNSINENIIVANINAGIALIESSNNNTIDGNSLRDNSAGILARDLADNNSISENVVANNGYAGINIESSFNTIFANNVSTNNGTGYGTGIFVLYSFNTVSGNSITNNDDGVYLFGSFNTISGNNISANKENGMYVTESSNNTILGNSITANGNGIYLYGSYNNSIFHNNFGDNTHQIGGESYFINTWDDGYPSGGNYWSDYNGTDANHDGIGDTPYVFDANNADNYPLMNPHIIPEFPSFLILPLLMIAALLTVIVYGRRWAI